jgi:putative ABC transport system substrate-binding protein
MMKRREFVTLLGGAAAWPLAAHAQQDGRMRRVSVLMGLAENDPEAQSRLAALTRGLRDLGWTEGRNLRIEYRGIVGGGVDRIRAAVAEFVASNPEVVWANNTTIVQELQRQPRSIPIVFAGLTDPVETGVVASLARPGGNATGFMNDEPALSGKWLELLKEVAPGVNRVLVLLNSGSPANRIELRTIEAAAPSFDVQVSSETVRDASEIESAIEGIARTPNAGLVITPGIPITDRRKLIFALASRYRLPAVYTLSFFAVDGGLLSYGPDILDMFRRSATYVDRILKGEKPGDLPVQGPVKYELVINLSRQGDRPHHPAHPARPRRRDYRMNRREFITLLGGAAAWPLAVRAQQGGRVRRIGVLMPRDENDPLTKAYLSAFTQALANLSWIDGRNVRMDARWWGDDVNRSPALAQGLVGLQPDIIVTNGTVATLPVQRETRTIPIVFAGVADPVASGIVPRLNQPGGNITGFANFEATLGGKWLELLTEIAPGLKRAAIMFNADRFSPLAAAAPVYMPSLETAARSLKVVLITTPVRSDLEIETAITALGREPGGGLVVMPDGFLNVHRAPIISAAARNKVPAVYGYSYFARDGGLLSYEPDQVDAFRRAASYVDRILRGEKPGDLPVQLPTKFEMVVNRKTAMALGLEIPPSIMLRADEVIE